MWVQHGSFLKDIAHFGEGSFAQGMVFAFFHIF